MKSEECASVKEREREGGIKVNLVSVKKASKKLFPSSLSSSELNITFAKPQKKNSYKTMESSMSGTSIGCSRVEIV